MLILGVLLILETARAAAPARPHRPPPVRVATRPAPRAARYNIRANPLGLIFGTLDLGFDITLNGQWTIGPMLRYASRSGDLDDGRTNYAVHYLGVGARGTWFRNGVFRQGLYAAPTATYVNAGVKLQDSKTPTTEYSASGLMVGGLVGYGWFWDSFNVMVGGGADVTLGPQQIRVRDSSGRSNTVGATLAGLAFETSLGCTF